ncbi:MAG: hypothetical protein NVSMB29_03820 [Candidatus Dormibacteria bacterium]
MGVLAISGLLLPHPAAAAPAPPTPAAARPPASWWQRVAFAGQRITAVEVDGSSLVVRTDRGRRHLSQDGGDSFASLSGGGFAGPRASCPIKLRSPEPLLQCAAPAGLPGVLLGVDAEGGVWRRTTAGSWSRSLLLLPQGGLRPAPRVTAITAFSGPATTDTVYLGTDGYSVLETTDAGDDWLRGGPGLPDRVFALAADSKRQTLYAGTADGLWRHRLQPLPAPPRYVAADLLYRRLATALVTLLAIGAGLAGMRVVLGRRCGPGP